MEEFLKMFCISKRRRFNFSEVIPIRWSFNWKRFPHGRKKVSVMVLTYKTHAAKPVSSEMRFSNLPHQFKCPQKWTSFCFLPASRVAERTAIYLTQNLTGRRRSALGGLSLVLFPISPPTIPPLESINILLFAAHDFYFKASSATRIYAAGEHARTEKSRHGLTASTRWGWKTEIALRQRSPSDLRTRNRIAFAVDQSEVEPRYVFLSPEPEAARFEWYPAYQVIVFERAEDWRSKLCVFLCTLRGRLWPAAFKRYRESSFCHFQSTKIDFSLLAFIHRRFFNEYIVQFLAKQAATVLLTYLLNQWTAIK